MSQVRIVAGLVLALVGCASIGPGKLLVTEDTKDRYVELREDPWGSYVSKIGHVNNRPDLKHMREVHGNLEFICTEIHGLSNPRIVIESKNKAHYQVVYKWGDYDALKVIAKPLGLLVTQEEREIQALTVRVSLGSHHLRPATKSKQFKLEDVCSDSEGRWPLDGVTADELARFLETRYRHPVVNLTGLEGKWSILLSDKAGRKCPAATEKVQLDDLGLDLGWEKVKIPVTVVKDMATEQGK